MRLYEETNPTRKILDKVETLAWKGAQASWNEWRALEEEAKNLGVYERVSKWVSWPAQPRPVELAQPEPVLTTNNDFNGHNDDRINRDSQPKLHWFLDDVRSRLYDRDMNLLAMIVGQPGIGKSFLGLRIGEKLDPTFDVSRVVFDAREFMRTLNNLEDPKGKVILFDESGQTEGYGHRAWFSSANKVLGDTLQSFRFKNLCVLFTLPSPNLLDLVGRGLQHLMIRVTSRGRALVYRVEPNYHPPGPEIRHRRLGRIVCGLPSERLTGDYLEKKETLLKARYKQFEARLEAHIEEGPKEPKPSRAQMILSEVRKNPVPYLDENGKLDYRKLQSGFDCSTNIAYSVISKYRDLSSPGTTS